MAPDRSLGAVPPGSDCRPPRRPPQAQAPARPRRHDRCPSTVAPSVRRLARPTPSVACRDRVGRQVRAQGCAPIPCRPRSSPGRTRLALGAGRPRHTRPGGQRWRRSKLTTCSRLAPAPTPVLAQQALPRCPSRSTMTRARTPLRRAAPTTLGPRCARIQLQPSFPSPCPRRAQPSSQGIRSVAPLEDPDASRCAPTRAELRAPARVRLGRNINASLRFTPRSRSRPASSR